MAVLTSVQVKQVAKFLTASCAKIPQQSNPPTHSQWLEVVAHASGFRDWNAMKATVANDPVLDNDTARWPNAYRTFFGVARVLIAGALLHKSAIGQGIPNPKKIYAAATVWGVPRAVN